jgi:hypothetical protein
MWAIFVASCGASWGSFTLLTEIPSYMDNIMDFNISEVSRFDPRQGAPHPIFAE